ncbi:hypothetical protein TWF173_004592 [Orbilia oligospora]|nr:hypothetical protein TWF173_004592 [Orbilia oligospora]
MDKGTWEIIDLVLFDIRYNGRGAIWVWIIHIEPVLKHMAEFHLMRGQNSDIVLAISSINFPVSSAISSTMFLSSAGLAAESPTGGGATLINGNSGFTTGGADLSAILKDSFIHEQHVPNSTANLC